MSARVLIVEDDEILRDIYSMKFKLEGFVVDSAKDGQEALEKVAVSMPELIILDMLMPRMGGMDFLRQFRALYKVRTVKILVASNKSDEAMMAEAIGLGAVDYLIKSQLTPEDIVVMAQKRLNIPGQVAS